MKISSSTAGMSQKMGMGGEEKKFTNHKALYTTPCFKQVFNKQNSDEITEDC
jgi:hypothetical protein